MVSATVAAGFLFVFGFHWVSVLGRANRPFSKLEEPCQARNEIESESVAMFNDSAVEVPLRVMYEILQNMAEHGTHVVANLKTAYYADRNIEDGDLQDLMLFVLRELPEVHPVDLGDLEDANATIVSRDIYRQLSHASRIVMQAKLDEMTLEVHGGFQAHFRALENHMYALLCHLKGVLMLHNEDIQHDVVAEVLRLPMYTPHTRARRVVRDCLVLEYLQIVTTNTQEYFNYLRHNL